MRKRKHIRMHIRMRMHGHRHRHRHMHIHTVSVRGQLRMSFLERCPSWREVWIHLMWGSCFHRLDKLLKWFFCLHLRGVLICAIHCVRSSHVTWIITRHIPWNCNFRPFFIFFMIIYCSLFPVRFGKSFNVKPRPGAWWKPYQSQLGF